MKKHNLKNRTYWTGTSEIFVITVAEVCTNIWIQIFIATVGDCHSCREYKTYRCVCNTLERQIFTATAGVQNGNRAVKSPRETREISFRASASSCARHLFTKQSNATCDDWKSCILQKRDEVMSSGIGYLSCPETTRNPCQLDARERRYCAATLDVSACSSSALPRMVQTALRSPRRFM